jgi:hypothetical protein
MEVLQGFIVVISRSYFSFVIPRLLALEGTYPPVLSKEKSLSNSRKGPFTEAIPEGSTTDLDRMTKSSPERVSREPEDKTMSFFILHTLLLVLEARSSLYGLLLYLSSSVSL